ncbi:DUF2235 domain-containing protein [Methylocystis echinoides]|uniref:DUF2235 domain-containing protein n=1 Tax=Methylocystis echinoides TaxID=29468 RepID=UPI00341A854A
MSDTTPVSKKNKRLVVFCDGTWNKEDQKSRNGQPCPTNVLRLFELTRPGDGDGCLQIVHYVRGVGNRWDERITGGGFGLGISQNIKDAYQFLVSNYEAGDEIFLFGFSRGAFTVRSLAGMVFNVGILRRDALHLLEEAYKHYRSDDPKWHPSSEESKAFRKNHTHGGETIKFLGVWDTVGALGAPFGFFIGKLLNMFFPTQFHDTKISPIILNAYHACAIDEKRWPFRPTRMELTPKREQEVAQANEAELAQKYQYEEAWFPGVHSDVGGGYEDSSLSDCALQWMVEKAVKHGLCVNDFSLIGSRPFDPNPLVPIHDSQNGFYRFSTKVFVYWLKPLLKILDKSEAPLIERVQENGDFLRQIDRSAALAADPAEFPLDVGFQIDLSSCARDKLAQDGDYAPLNLKKTRAHAPVA